MRDLEKPIGRVFRRMRFQRFLAALVWWFAGSLVVVAVALAVERFAVRPLPGPAWWPFATAGGVSLLAAALTAVLSGPSRVDAAVAIDHAFHLNERLSTALTLPENLLETAAGRALVADAIRHVADLDIGSRFGPRLPRRSWLPLVPAALSLALFFVPAFTQKPALGKASETLDKQAVVKQTTLLGKKIASQRKDLEKGKFAEADKLLAEIQKAADEMAKAPPAQKDKALVELNKLTDAIKDRQKQLGSPEQMARQLQQLKEMASNGPADEFAKDLAKADFAKAAQELKKLQEKLASGKLSEAEKKALKEQLGEMSKQLEKLANFDQRRKQLEEARKNGGLSQEQFDKEMAKLDDQAKSMKQLQQLATKMAEAEKSLQKGDLQKAASALGMTQQQLSDMAKQLSEMDSLDGALADLQDAKNGMTGDGMNQLGENPMGGGMSEQRRGMGNGLGRGRGQGDRPEAPDQTSLYTTKVAQQYRKGKAIFQGYGPSNTPMKGVSVIDIQREIEAGGGLSADALTNQKVPKNIEKHIRGYFDEVGKGR